MKTRRIVTEDPSAEQWRMLAQFYYEPNIVRFAKTKNLSPTQATINYIAGSLRQGEAYFTSAQSAPIDIAPLLLYYGLTNLMVGVGALLTGNVLPIDHHGMKIDLSQLPVALTGIGTFHEGTIDSEFENENHERLGADNVCISSGNPNADYQFNGLAATLIKPLDKGKSGLFRLVEIFSPLSKLRPHICWSLGEIFGSVPDIRDDYLHRYEDAPSFVVPVQLVRRRHTTFEKVRVAHLKSYAHQFPDDIYPGNFLKAIPNFDQAYLEPQRVGGGFVPLRRKLNGIDIGIYSMFGRKHLALPHIKVFYQKCLRRH